MTPRPEPPASEALPGEGGPVVPLSGTVEGLLLDWALAPTAPGPRADDAMIHLTTSDKRFVGTLTLGWFRRNTTYGALETAVLNAESRVARLGARGDEAEEEPT